MRGTVDDTAAIGRRTSPRRPGRLPAAVIDASYRSGPGGSLTGPNPSHAPEADPLRSRFPQPPTAGPISGRPSHRRRRRRVAGVTMVS
jgi:hypothetical protein